MKYFLVILIFFSRALLAEEKIVIFIDSANNEQVSLIEDINKMLFYSPTLRSEVEINVFDINPVGKNFSGSLTYRRDEKGIAISHYRPDKLPLLICMEKKIETFRTELKSKAQLCLCTQKC